MIDCIFCKIIEREIPSEIVYEDETVLGFKDINPAGPVHILFVPKKHYETLNDIPPGDYGILSDMMKAVVETAKKEGVDRSGYRVITNVNRDAGQVVFHLHVHLIGGKRLGKMG